MDRRIHSTLAILMAIWILVGCNLPGQVTAPTPFPADLSIQQTQTQIAFIQTLAASLTPAPATPIPATETPAPSSGSISGTVWHDLCAPGGEGEAAPTSPPAGCVEGSQGGYDGNGIFESGELGIEGVVVSLGAGQCPASGLATINSDSGGNYRFESLSPGAYCVSVDSLGASNDEMLVPGGWTYPMNQSGAAVAEASVTVGAGQAVSDVNFGWDYQFLPAEPQSGSSDQGQTGGEQTGCAYRADFVSDVTIPDGSRVTAGRDFVKTWRVRNEGTCTWGPDGYDLYAIGYVSGDRMSARRSVELPEVVRPGDTVDVSVTFTAPNQPGRYRSNWQLLFADGDLLGLGRRGEGYLFVEITVPSSGSSSSGSLSRVSFEPGATSATVEDDLSAEQSDRYILRALKGQWLVATLDADDDAKLELFEEDGDRVSLSAEVKGSYFLALLPATQDYIVRVSALDDPISYDLTIEIPSRIRFESGAFGETIEGFTDDGRTVTYVLRALAGQTMTIDLDADGDAVLEIYALADGKRLLKSSAGKTSASVDLPENQDYLISVVPEVSGEVDFVFDVVVK